MAGRYVNPFTDFGFKKLFGMEVNKDLLIDFLNTLLHTKGEIKLLTYLPTKRLDGELYDRKAILMCIYLLIYLCYLCFQTMVYG